MARLLVIGHYFQSLHADHGDGLATDAIGAVAYAADLKVFDINGIVDVHIAHHGTSKQALGDGWPGHERMDLPYVFAKNPKFFMFDRVLTPEPMRFAPVWLTDEVGPQIAREYRITSAWLDDPVNHDRGYFNYLERKPSAALASATGKP